MKKTALSLITFFTVGFSAVTGLCVDCGAENAAALEEKNTYIDDYHQQSAQEILDYDPQWDMELGYLGSYHDTESGFSAEMFQGGAVISGCSKISSNVAIPNTLGGKNVVAIQESAFQGNKYITEVKLPEGLKYIGANSFGNCTNLKRVEFPSTLFSIEASAFYKCPLVSVALPDSLYSIGMGAFSECGELKTVVFSANIERICAYAFKNSGIEQADLPSKLTHLGKGSFQGCEKLKTVNFNNSLETIHTGAFSGCENLTSVTLPKVNTIEENAFYGCGLNSVRLYEGLTEIGNQAFMDCKNLTKAELPQGLTEIGEGAFEGCESLQFADIPDSVTYIGDFAFSKCSSLTRLHLSSEVHQINRNTFSDCSSLVTVVIPDNVNSIGSEAFSWCTSLESVYIPPTVTYICGDAFLMEDTSKITITGEFDSAARFFAERRDITFKVNADEGQQSIMLTVIISVWSFVLILCVIFIAVFSHREKSNVKKSEIKIS